MSLWNTIVANTYGVFYSARTGNVDPWTAANDKEEQTAAAIQALGPYASDAAKRDAAAQVASIYDTQLTAASANPANGCQTINFPIFGCLNLQNTKNLIDKIIFVGAVGSAVYFTVKYRQSIKRGLLAAKKDLKL
jgi:hypothetical protein